VRVRRVWRQSVERVEVDDIDMDARADRSENLQLDERQCARVQGLRPPDVQAASVSQWRGRTTCACQRRGPDAAGVSRHVGGH